MEAVIHCETCGKPLCRKCAELYNGHPFCATCGMDGYRDIKNSLNKRIIVGWLIYFFIKLCISIVIGWVAAPIQIYTETQNLKKSKYWNNNVNKSHSKK